ncbi:FHA domain-containing protein [Actinomyces gerencseriae]|uniref:FHA domain-containing protein n=1 Tax=Actinomyces gerencseriae TaxID=52769 RepID=UPI000415A71D|nr:FHA domain-containing protein [Actinomyces gerencseriae]
MSEHGIARWSRWAEGSWTAAVAPHGVLVLPPTLSEESVIDLWEELRSSQGSLTAILDRLVIAAGGHLSKIPDFALVVTASDGVRIAARGQVGLEIDGESVEARSVSTWREIYLPGSPRIILRAPEPTGPVLRPVVDAVLSVSAVFPAEAPGSPAGEEESSDAEDEPDPDASAVLAPPGAESSPAVPPAESSPAAGGSSAPVVSPLTPASPATASASPATASSPAAGGSSASAFSPATPASPATASSPAATASSPAATASSPAATASSPAAGGSSASAFSPATPASPATASSPAAPPASSSAPVVSPLTPASPATASSPAAPPASPSASSSVSPASPSTFSSPDTAVDGSEVVELTEAEELPIAGSYGIDVDDVPVDGSQVVELADADRPADVDDVPRMVSADSPMPPIGSALQWDEPYDGADDRDDDDLDDLDAAGDERAVVSGISGGGEDDPDQPDGEPGQSEQEEDLPPEGGDHDGWTLASLPGDLVDELGPLASGRPGALSRAQSQAKEAASAFYAHEPSTDTPVSIAVGIRRPDYPAAGRQALSVLCPEGHANPTNYVRCRACGAELSQPARMITCPPLGRLRLSSGQAVTLDRPILVGRQPSSIDVPQLEGQSPTLVTVPSPEQLISRNHVLIELDEWSVLARNLSAGNGTVLKRDGVSPQKLPYTEPLLLRNGDVLDLGDGQSLVLEDLP